MEFKLHSIDFQISQPKSNCLFFDYCLLKFVNGPIFFDFCKVRQYSRTLLAIIILQFAFISGYSQGQETNWYFGNMAGLNFGTTPPTALTNSAMNAFEGCATISDTAGNLLFYTNGNMVWNKNHNTMPTGNALNGDGAATQTAIIVPAPQNLNKYYIFTVDTNGGTRGLCYSEVDMSLNGGLGDVTVKNVQLITPVTEKLTAIKRANNIDVWVVVHGWNSDAFHVFQITPAGVNTTPITSNVGSVHGGSFTFAHGYMKASQDAQKLACAIRGGLKTELFDFDNINGTVSNAVPLTATTQVYGLEFSPNSKYLYVAATSNPGTITQYDAKAGNAAAVIASATVIGTYSGLIGALQRGPDNKIYVCQFQSTSLGIIPTPDLAGTAAGFIPNGIFLGGKTSQYGLPNFLQSFFLVADFTYADTCSGSNTQFTLTLPNPNPDSVIWNFNDPLSGANDTSTLLNPTHQFTTAGTYTVELIAYQSLLTDTVRRTIQIVATPAPNLGSNFSICEGNTQILNPGTFSAGASLLWQDGSTASNYVADTTEQVIVTVTDLAGCIGKDTVDVTWIAIPVPNLGANSIYCEGDTILLDATEPNATYFWQDGSTDSVYHAYSTGTYIVEVTVDGCMGTDNVDLTFDPVPIVNLGADTTLCKGIPLYLDATNPNATYIWQDGTTNSSQIIFDPGTYVVNVTIGTCTKSDTIVIDQQDQPIVDLGEDTLLCYGQPLLYDAYNYGAIYEWQDGSTNVTYEPKSPGNYYVTATNQCGSDADSVEVMFEVCNCLVYMPEAFTPNSDNKNDVFNYKYNCTNFEATFDIYNRFGEHVFSAVSPDEAWDGTFKGTKSPPGLYIYILHFKGYDNGHYVDTKQKGYFSLIR